MAEPAADYHRGEMDIHEQVSTFHAFLKMTKWFSLHLAAVLVFVIMWFCTGAGFLASLITGIVLFVVGVFALRERHTPGH